MNVLPKAGVPHRARENATLCKLYGNEFFKSNSMLRKSRNRPFDKVRQFKFDLFFGTKNEKSNAQMKCRMRKKGPLKPFERPQHHFFVAFERIRLWQYANELTTSTSFA